VSRAYAVAALLDLVFAGALGLTRRHRHTRCPAQLDRRAGLDRTHAGLAPTPSVIFAALVLAAREAWPLKCRMACTPATGTWPNPSFEATSSGRLRLPTAAPQLKR